MISAKSKALQLLARREYSAAELIQALCKKGYPEEEAKTAIAAMQELGYQSDERFTQCFVRDKVRAGNGPLKISYLIQQKGIDDFSAHMEEPIEWEEAALQLLQKRFSVADLTTKEAKDKALRYIYSRGFHQEMCRKVLKKYLAG